ncbi:DM13 domain-containing protein [Microbacterium nymphoidis]|uniref:DM13 domain-containing protein n=1 Tax=Microbacterium nymphoidis TaxID=2898586 RepID=UPI001E5B263C|nr:DM13 domain-containing protein [Microbacterium nymphoidis]MCD2498161.1 DM13 domain-containing protein [Microbacterium nymphoidis]
MRTRMALGTAAAAIVLAAGLSGCTSMADSGSGMSASEPTAMSTMSASQPSAMSTTDDAVTMMKSGTFMGLNDKMVSGTVTIEDGKLTLSGFSSDEGPDLHVYLTNGTDEAAVTAGMMIDKVAFDKADQTFALSGVDLSKYTDVVIHCDKAKAVFGAAALS